MRSDSTRADKPPGNANKEMLDELQRVTFGYFTHEFNSDNGLVADKTRPGWAASIAATGFALTVYPVGVEHGWMEREEAVQRTLTTLRFFWNSPQSKEPEATGYKGFYYHFLDMTSGRRVWKSELSSGSSTIMLPAVYHTGRTMVRSRRGRP